MDGGGVAEERRESEVGTARTDPSIEEMERRAPPERGGREARVGLFVILGLAAFLAVLFLMTDPSTFRGRYMVTTEVTDAGGLRRGDPVQMRGVNIGRVHAFGLVEGGVIITLEIEGDWGIPRGSAARLVSSGLLGGRIVEIVPSESAETVPAGASIPGQNVEGLVETAGDLGPRVRSTIGHAESALERVETLLDVPTVESLQGSAVELRTVLREMSALVRQQGLEIAALTESLNRSAAGFEEAAAGGGDIASAAARADSTLLQLNRTATTLDRTAGSLETVLARLEAGEGSLGLLLTDEELYTNLTRAAESVRRLADDVRENPRRYVDFRVF